MWYNEVYTGPYAVTPLCKNEHIQDIVKSVHAVTPGCIAVTQMLK